MSANWTQKDFEVLADMLVELADKLDDSLKVDFDTLAQVVIKTCKINGPRFDEDKFHAWFASKIAEKTIVDVGNEVVSSAEQILKRVK